MDGEGEQGDKRPEGMCAMTDCTVISTKRCGRCKVVFYCCKDHQVKHWKTHKEECRLFCMVPEKPDGNFSEDMVKAHHREFRRIVQQYGLDKGNKADLLADFLTDATGNAHILPKELATKFSIPQEEASTLLAWVDVALRFKEENLDKKPEEAAMNINA
eukprot:m.240806 g.240806  ORF g.240806 m.240806 type:complete len:159 (+) comp16096_c0_seq1:80-556(+)